MSIGCNEIVQQHGIGATRSPCRTTLLNPDGDRDHCVPDSSKSAHIARVDDVRLIWIVTLTIGFHISETFFRHGIAVSFVIQSLGV